MRALIPCLALVVSGCGGADERSAGEAMEAVEKAVQTASLTGLYEGGPPGRRSQMCIVDRGVGDARFGLVVRGEGGRSCSGSGGALRSGGRLRLSMAGAEPCVIDAAIADRRVTLPQTLPPSCAYYCTADADIGGAVFEKVGGTPEDAMRASDLVGDPLCAGMVP